MQFRFADLGEQDASRLIELVLGCTYNKQISLQISKSQRSVLLLLKAKEAHVVEQLVPMLISLNDQLRHEMVGEPQWNQRGDYCISL